MYQLWLSDSWLQTFLYTYSTIPAKIVHGEQRYSLITSMFLHGWWMHIIGNMLFLKTFWDNVEARMGNFTFLLFYLIAWVVWWFAHVLTDTASMIPSLGASGAISGVLGAYLVMFPGSRVKILNLTNMSTLFVWASQFLIYWIGLQVVTWFGSLAWAADGWVAYFAHIGWFATWWIRWVLTRWRYKKWELISAQSTTIDNNDRFFWWWGSRF